VLKSITSKPLWFNLLVVLLLVLLLVLFFFGILGWLTKHNDYQKVPSVLGQNVEAATKMLEAKGFDVTIQDSVYVDSAAKLSVLKQSPEPDAVVKANRTIYITINRAVPPLTSMPSMIGFSFRSAEMMLLSLGLKLGDTTYKPDIGKNTVLEQLYQGKAIAPNTKVPMGSTIDFVLGSGVGSEEMNVPANVIGMTLNQAKQYLGSLNIGIGAISPSEMAGNGEAYVYKTNPPAFNETTPGQRTNNKIRPGQLLDLFVSVEKPVTDTVAPAPDNNQK